MEGRVGVTSASDPHRRMKAAAVETGDVLVATANSTSVKRESPQAMASDFSWLHGMLVFDDVALSKVVAEFNRYSAEEDRHRR